MCGCGGLLVGGVVGLLFLLFGIKVWNCICCYGCMLCEVCFFVFVFLFLCFLWFD